MDMISIEDCVLAGKISRKWGFDNEVVVGFSSGVPSDESDFPVFFLVKIDNTLIPYFVESYREHGPKSFIVSFYDTDASTRDRLTGRACYLPSDMAQQSADQEVENDVTGYTVSDQRWGTLGKITRLIDRHMQPLLQVESQGKEILIPFTDHLITTIDHRKREVLVDLPDGLLDL